MLNEVPKIQFLYYVILFLDICLKYWYFTVAINNLLKKLSRADKKLVT